MKRLLTQKSLAILFLLISVAFLLPGSSTLITAASFPSFPPTKTDYCYVPPFVTRSVPPSVMLIVQRDEKLYQPAYNDYTDLDGDGELETTYKHSIEYYGYFDPYKCYEYDTGNGKFTPHSITNDKYCTGSAAGKWSGNFLNWATMTRMDVMRKVLYGGYRSYDPSNTSGATLERAFLPQDTHSFAKVYTGGDKNKLTPYSDASLTFCNTTLASASNPPMLRVAKGNQTGDTGWPRWASVERWQCAYATEHSDSAANSFRPAYATQRIGDFTVRVDVANPALIGKERVKQYPSGNYKPIGLLQQYGEGSTDKVCSKTGNKTCLANSDCGANEGTCIDRSPMYFGLITGSFQKNKSGGVLRSKITDIANSTSGDINRTTGAFTGAQGGIINTINNLRIVRYNYSDGLYNTTDSCPWGAPNFVDGNCSNWGNPLGEMYYEAIRYFSGLGSNTSAYDANDSSYITGLKKETWNSQVDPYSYMPHCSKAFVLILNDVTPSYDSDQLPGGYLSFGSIPGDLTGLSSTLNVSDETRSIGIKEGYAGNQYFIGQSGATATDNQCTAKTVSDLSQVRGLCPNGGATQGSYYLAGLAWFAKKTDLRPTIPAAGSPSKQNITTFVVALDSGMPEIKAGPFTILPACYNASYSHPCRLVNFRQLSKTATSGSYYFNWEDSLQGGDTDEDADGILSYTITGSQITISTQVLYSSTPHHLQIGYSINGTTTSAAAGDHGDGIYTETSNGAQASTYATCTNFGASPPNPKGTCASRTHYQGTSAATFMKNPLWLASKYGGFEGGDSVTEPEQGGMNYWDQRINATGELGSDGIPDTYFEARNPLQLESQLIRALNDILERSNSGTTLASMPPNASRESFIVPQSFFFHQKTDGNVLLKWIGYLQVLWADGAGNLRENSSVSGETNVLKWFDLVLDKIAAYYYNTSESKTKVIIYKDSNGDTIPDSCAPDGAEKDVVDVQGAIEAGQILKTTSPDARRIFFWYDGGTLGTVDAGEFVKIVKDDSAQAAHFAPLWSYGSSDVCDSDCAKAVMKYVLGYDRPNGKNYTLRQSVTTGTDLTNTWKLGDSIFSSPKIWPDRAANGWVERYGDATYRSFIENTIAISSQTPLVIAGANDGLVHAFRLGKYSQVNPPTTPKTIGRLDTSDTSPAGLTKLGDEVWSYMPRNVIPYIRWYCDRESCHIPLVDSNIQIVDASIGGPAAGAKNATSWRRLLIGTMGFGGSAIQVGTSVATKMTFSSSIFVLDVTDALNPALLWEKTLPDTTLTSSQPGIVRLGDRNQNGSWYLVIGSGPQRVTTTSLGYVSTPKIYVFDLKTGQSMISGGATIDASVTDVAVGDILSADLDSGMNDYQADDLYFGTYGGTNANPKGHLYRMRIRNGNTYFTNPVDWKIERVVTLNDRVVSAPSVTSDQYNTRWLYFGTGMYITQDDVTQTTGYLYGFKDKTACWTGSCPAYTNFYDTSAITFVNGKADAKNCLCEGGVYFASVDCSPPGTCGSCPDGVAAVSRVSGAVVDGLAACNGTSEDAGIACIESFLKNYDGWKWRDTAVQGKFYAKTSVAGGAVTEAYFRPDSDICSLGGNTWLAALNYTTGTPFFSSIILAADATDGSDTSVTMKAQAYLGGGAPALGGGSILYGGGATYKIRTGGGGGGGGRGTDIRPPVEIEWNRFIQWVTR